jgi:hypothetical protein
VKLPEWKRHRFNSDDDWLNHYKTVKEVFEERPGAPEQQKSRYLLTTIDPSIRSLANTAKVIDFANPNLLPSCEEINEKMQRVFPHAGKTGNSLRNWSLLFEQMSQEKHEPIVQYVARIKAVLAQYLSDATFWKANVETRRANYYNLEEKAIGALQGRSHLSFQTPLEEETRTRTAKTKAKSMSSI